MQKPGKSAEISLSWGAYLDLHREIELRPKSFALLRYLVENAGRLVPKDELVNVIWPSVVLTESRSHTA